MTLSRIRDRELILDLPGDEWPTIVPEEWRSALHCRANCVAVAMAGPRLSVGKILLPDETGSRHRPDFGIIVGSGDPQYRVGDKVGLRPYRGIHFHPLVCHKAGDPFVSSYTDSSIKLCAKRVAILPDRKYERDSGLAVAFPRASQTGVIVAAGPEANVPIGVRAVFSRRRHDRNILGIASENLLHDRVGDWIICQSDQIVAMIHESGPRADYVRFLAGPHPVEKQICVVESNGEWLPAPGWVQLEDAFSQSGSVLLRPSARLRAPTWRVRNSALDDIPPGKRIVSDPHPNKVLRFGIGSENSCAFMRREDIWMVID